MSRSVQRRGPETVGQIRRRAERDAGQVRDAYCGGRTPTSPVALAHALGVNVFTAELSPEMLGMVVGAFSGADIFLNRGLPVPLARYACACALGHYVDHALRIDPLGEGEGYYIPIKLQDAAEALYADTFAQALLRP